MQQATYACAELLFQALQQTTAFKANVAGYCTVFPALLHCHATCLARASIEAAPTALRLHPTLGASVLQFSEGLHKSLYAMNICHKRHRALQHVL